MKHQILFKLACGAGVLALCVSLSCNKLESSSKPLPLATADPGSGYTCNTTGTVYDIFVSGTSFTLYPQSETFCYTTGQTPGGTTPTPPPPTVTWTASNSIYTSVSGTVIRDSAVMGCYDTARFGTVVIYVKQAGSGSGNVVNVGDAWVEVIELGVRRVFGFYPTGGLYPIVSPSGPGEFIDRAGALFDYSLEFGATQPEMANIWKYVTLYMPSHMTYNFNTFNTIDFAVMIAKLAGVPLTVSQEHFGNAGWATSADYLANVLQYTEVSSSVLTQGGGADSDLNPCH